MSTHISTTPAEPLDDAALAEIAARVKAASEPGEWWSADEIATHLSNGTDFAYDEVFSDAELMAHARLDLPALLSAIQRLRARVEQLEHSFAVSAKIEMDTLSALIAALGLDPDTTDCLPGCGAGVAGARHMVRHLVQQRDQANARVTELEVANVRLIARRDQLLHQLAASADGCRFAELENERADLRARAAELETALRRSREREEDAQERASDHLAHIAELEAELDRVRGALDTSYARLDALTAAPAKRELPPKPGPAIGSTRMLYRALGEIATERRAQDAKWGQQSHPDGTGSAGWRSEARAAREACQRAAAAGAVTWRHILLEEVMEAFAEADPARLRGEVVQVAAVAVAWVEAIDRRLSATTQPETVEHFDEAAGRNERDQAAATPGTTIERSN